MKRNIILMVVMSIVLFVTSCGNAGNKQEEAVETQKTEGTQTQGTEIQGTIVQETATGETESEMEVQDTEALTIAFDMVSYNFLWIGEADDELASIANYGDMCLFYTDWETSGETDIYFLRDTAWIMDSTGLYISEGSDFNGEIKFTCESMTEIPMPSNYVGFDGKAYLCEGVEFITLTSERVGANLIPITYQLIENGEVVGYLE